MRKQATLYKEYKEWVKVFNESFGENEKESYVGFMNWLIVKYKL